MYIKFAEQVGHLGWLSGINVQSSKEKYLNIQYL